MQLFRVVAGAAAMALLPVLSTAQTTTTTTTTTRQTTVDVDIDEGPRDGHWLASGFVGSNFGSDTGDASVDFGGSIGYLWRGIIGPEFQANFSPEFDLEPRRSALLLGDQPWINSYMVNAMAAIPVGTNRTWQPYVSGGLGALTLRSDVIQDPDTGDIDPDDTRFGGNIGVGILGFMGNVGIRGDVRYFGGFDEDTVGDGPDSPAEAIGSRVLSNLTFWRANVGVAFRW